MLRNKPEPKDSRRRIVLRALVCVSLVLLILIFAPFLYYKLTNAENQLYEEQYNRLAKELLNQIRLTVDRAQYAGVSMATFAGVSYPLEKQWPNASMLGYSQINNNIYKGSNMRVTLVPIVYPQGVGAFENFARSVFDADPEVPADAGESDFGFGIFSRDQNGNKYHDTTGETSFSSRNILLPILYSAFPATTKAFLYNVHSEEVRGRAFDSSLTCIEEGSWNCEVMTDIVEHISNEEYYPITLLISPILPYHNSSQAVGFTITSFSWFDALEGILPTLGKSIDCVVSTGTQMYTFELRRGNTTLKGRGGKYDKRFSSNRKTATVELTDSSASSTTQYTLDIYPTQEFYDEYHSNSPLIVAVISVSLVLFTCVVFVCYDGLVQRETGHLETVLAEKSRFVRFISHEIRTPLNTVIMGLKLLEQEILGVDVCKCHAAEIPGDEGSGEGEDICCASGMDAKKSALMELTKEIQGSSDVAVTILSDLLQYDKIVVGKLSIEKIPVQMWSVIEEVLLFQQVEAHERDMNLVYKADIFQTPVHHRDSSSALKYEIMSRNDTSEDSLVLAKLYVCGDRVRLAQVLRNIISNALKFSPPKSSILVTASWKPHDILPSTEQQKENSEECKGSLLISVHDSGPGISREDLQFLFGEGVQFNPNELQSGQGSGLGLFICKSIIELHGGSIWAESEGEGKGCVFHVQLPVFRSIATDLEMGTINLKNSLTSNLKIAPITSDAQSSNRMPPGRSPNIKTDSLVLVVDDALSNRKMLCRMLTNRGYECLTAEDGLQCIEIMKSSRGKDVKCILMDFVMPKMTGPEATKEIRKLGYHSVSIIGVTGNVMKEDIDHFIACGADNVFEKPLNMDLFDQLMTCS